MAGERGAQDSGAVHSGCPLQCRLRQAAGADTASQGSVADEVDWAGLPVNLDLVFSQQQRDKVYGQYLRLRRGTQLWRWLPNGTQRCACELAADGQAVRDAVDSVSSR